MDSDLPRVSPAETQAEVAKLRDLCARASANDQTFLAMALALAAESLEENAMNADEWDAEDAG